MEITKTDQEKKLEKAISIASNFVNGKWEKLAEQLDLGDVDERKMTIQEIKNSSSKGSEQCRQFLSEWWMYQGDEASVEKLYEALVRARLKRVADFLLREKLVINSCARRESCDPSEPITLDDDARGGSACNSRASSPVAGPSTASDPPSRNLRPMHSVRKRKATNPTSEEESAACSSFDSDAPPSKRFKLKVKTHFVLANSDLDEALSKHMLRHKMSTKTTQDLHDALMKPSKTELREGCVEFHLTYDEPEKMLMVRDLCAKGEMAGKLTDALVTDELLEELNIDTDGQTIMAWPYIDTQSLDETLAPSCGLSCKAHINDPDHKVASNVQITINGSPVLTSKQRGALTPRKPTLAQVAVTNNMKGSPLRELNLQTPPRATSTPLQSEINKLKQKLAKLQTDFEDNQSLHDLDQNSQYHSIIELYKEVEKLLGRFGDSRPTKSPVKQPLSGVSRHTQGDENGCRNCWELKKMLRELQRKNDALTIENEQCKQDIDELYSSKRSLERQLRIKGQGHLDSPLPISPNRRVKPDLENQSPQYLSPSRDVRKSSGRLLSSAIPKKYKLGDASRFFPSLDFD